MAELKTKKTDASVSAFINSVEEIKREGSKKLVKIFSEATGEKPKMCLIVFWLMEEMEILVLNV